MRLACRLTIPIALAIAAVGIALISFSLSQPALYLNLQFTNRTRADLGRRPGHHIGQQPKDRRFGLAGQCVHLGQLSPNDF